MPAYKYVVRDRTGNSSTGTIEAKDVHELRRILRSNDLFLVTYKIPHGATTSATPTFGSRTPKAQDIVVSLRQLSTLIRSGLPVVRAFQIVEEQCASEVLKGAFVDIRETVTDGGTISGGMKKYPRVFSPLVTSFIEAGEAVGNLDSALDLASEQIDRDDMLRRQVKQATMYPKFVIGACGAATVAMLMVVVPSFKAVYSSMNVALPAPTQMLIDLNAFAMAYWWLIILVFGGGWYGLKRYQRTPDGQRTIDRIILKLPIAGPLARKIAIARVMQTLSDGLRGGVPLLKGLSIAAGTGGNSQISDAVASAAVGVREGSKISTKLAESGEFPSLVTQMIEAGEASGNLEEMLDEISRFYRRDVDYSLNGMTKLIEPLVTVVVGLGVLLLLIALYMPIFNISSVFQSGGK